MTVLTRADSVGADGLHADGFQEETQRGRPGWRILRGGGPQSLARRFLLIYGIVLVLATLGIGFWVGQQIETGILNRTAAITALYVHSFVAPEVQSLATQSQLTPAEVGGLGQQLTQTELGKRLVAFKVWSRDGRVLYSPTLQLVGQQFPLNDDRASSFAGQVTVGMSDLSSPENLYERQRFDRLIEMYIPILQNGSGEVLAVAEFYQLPDEVDAEVNSARIGAWSIVLIAAFASFVLVGAIVLRTGRTIAQQQVRLRDHVAELSTLVSQVADLNARLRNAGAQAVTISVQESRRISADLHDGPGQALALALLQFDDVRESAALAAPEKATDGKLQAAYDGIAGALREIREIAAGLRLPELAPLSVRDVIERAVRGHERRTGVSVALQLESLPANAPLAVKIGLFRALQEALSNATRHGEGIRVSVHAWVDGQDLHAEISDGGPGFNVAERLSNGGLGLPGMRERTALAGGTFEIWSAPGHGTSVRLSWPLRESPEVASGADPDGSAV